MRGMPCSSVVSLENIATLYSGVAGTRWGLAHDLSPENAALVGALTALRGGLAFGLLTLGARRSPEKP